MGFGYQKFSCDDSGHNLGSVEHKHTAYDQPNDTQQPRDNHRLRTSHKNFNRLRPDHPLEGRLAFTLRKFESRAT